MIKIIEIDYIISRIKQINHYHIDSQLLISIWENKEMIDFTKIYCHLHPHELITNFCNKDECLAGLCANCVCTHTELHISKGTAPQYQNIRMTYKKIQQNIRNQVEIFQKDKDRIDKINAKVIQKRQKVKQIMELAKEQVSILLGTYFDEKEKNMLRQIQAQQKKYGLHCQNRLQSLHSYISREVSNLVSAAQQLTSNNFLQSLPRIRTQYLVNSAKLHSQIQHEMIQNQKFSTTISCNKGLLYTLTQVLEKAITVGFNGQSFNQNMKKQNQMHIRPKSLGKIPEPMILGQNNPTFSNIPYPTKQRNLQSQMQIFSNPQGSGSSFKNTGEFRKSMYMQSPPFMNDRNFVDNKIQKISTTGFNPTSNINVGYSRSNLQKQSVQNNYLRNNNLNTSTTPSPPSFISKFQDQNYQQTNLPSNTINQQSTYRIIDKPGASNNAIQTFYSPQFTQMPSVSRPHLERSTASGLNKKSRKSGLKLVATTDGEQIMGQNENDKPWRMQTSYI